jgi:riboflavin kinase/FMN adenylyltransferase
VEIYRHLDDVPALAGSVVTVGNFDGVHVGHQGVLDRTVDRARQKGGKSIALTFVPHPVRILAPGNEPARLTPLERKLELIAKRHVDMTIVLPFDVSLASMTPRQFIEDVLVSGAGSGVVIVGSDFRFGKERGGDIELLERLGPKYGYEVEPFGPVLVDGEPVSSTRIRTILLEGGVELAAGLLGRPHDVAGVVVMGDRRGRLLGYPTANLGGLRALPPAKGVYACWARVGGARHMAAVNIGDRPTFGRGRSIEAYLLDFDGDLYGRELTLEFVARLRSDERFESVDALIEQIGRDVEQTRRLLHDDEQSQQTVNAER